MNYWLFKSEPEEYSIDDLQNEQTGMGVWDGIRNYQARNLLRDQVEVGDLVLFYHSSCRQVGVAGVARVVTGAYADPAQFDPQSAYFDGKSTQAAPRWVCVDVAFVSKFSTTLLLKQMKQIPELTEMVLFKQGRLSVQPVTELEFTTIVELAGEKQYETTL